VKSVSGHCPGWIGVGLVEPKLSDFSVFIFAFFDTIVEMNGKRSVPELIQRHASWLAILASVALIELARPPGWVEGAVLGAFVPLFLLLKVYAARPLLVGVCWALAIGFSWLRWLWPLIHYPREALDLSFPVSFSLMLADTLWASLPYFAAGGVGAIADA